MCDDSGIVYTGGPDDGQVLVDLGPISDIVLDLDDLDDQTKRELLIAGPPGKSPDPGCKWCGGTGRLKLLVSETECDCVR